MLMQEQKSAVEDPGRALNLGVGLASPLWPTFLATAGAGVAYWWWTQWTQVSDRSFAPLAAAKPFLKVVESPPPPAPVEPVIEAAAEASEAVGEAVQETAATTEAAMEQAADSVVEETTEAAASVAPAIEEPVEAAASAVVEPVEPAVVEPIEAIAEAAPPPTPRKQPVAAKSGTARASAPKPPARAGKHSRTPE